MLTQLRLMSGGRLVGPKSNIGWIQHHVIYAGVDKNGIEWVVENNESVGVRKITLHQLMCDFKITKVIRFLGSEKERSRAIFRAFKMLGVNYNLKSFNCEHYANHVQFNKLHSQQVENVHSIAKFFDYSSGIFSCLYSLP